MSAVPSGAPHPRHVCDECGEYLPHACAPLVTITRERWTGRRIAAITDRPAEVTEQAA